MLLKLKHKTTNNNVHQSPETVNEDGVKREDVVSIFQKYDQVIPLPLDSRHNPHKTPSEMNDTISGDLKALGFRDLKTLEYLIASKSSGDPLDDKTLLMERIIQLITALPPDSQRRTNLTEKFCASLVRETISPTHQSDCYTYRSADGSHNNPVRPGMGAAKTAYARLTNRPTTQPGGLPDPGLIFDSLFAREAFAPHPNKVSSLFSAWAMLIANDTFQTDPKDSSISETSSHLDLSILYGNNEYEQVQMRTFQFGRIKPDCFSNVKVSTMSPAAGVLLVMLNRTHYYLH